MGNYCVLRLGFRQVKGLREEDINVLLTGRATSFPSINALRDAGLSETALEKLADADAFRSVGLDRRQALWEVSTKDRPQALFSGQPAADARGENITLPHMQLSEQVVHDYAATSLSVKAHPVRFLREKLQQLHVLSAKELGAAKNGQVIKVAGLVLIRQRPETAKGVCFITIEDETGFANLVIFNALFDVYRKEILGAKLMMVEGKLQTEGEVIHVVVSKCYDLSKLLCGLTPANDENLSLLTLARPDVGGLSPTKGKQTAVKGSGQEKLFPESRDFK